MYTLIENRNGVETVVSTYMRYQLAYEEMLDMGEKYEVQGFQIKLYDRMLMIVDHLDRLYFVIKDETPDNNFDSFKKGSFSRNNSLSAA